MRVDHSDSERGQKYNFISSKAMSGIIVNYAWSQLANPVPVPVKKRRNGEDQLLPITAHRDRVFNEDAGSDASVSNVWDKMMTKNGVLMQVIINTVKVKRLIGLMAEDYKGILFSVTASDSILVSYAFLTGNSLSIKIKRKIFNCQLLFIKGYVFVRLFESSVLNINK